MNHCYQCSSLTSDEAKTAAMKGFGLCGKCAIDRKRNFGSDTMAPRNPRSGAFYGSASAYATNHRESFVYFLKAQVRDAYIANHEAQYGWRCSAPLDITNLIAA